MRILAIDYGLSKTGLAFFDGHLVRPLIVVKSDNKLKLINFIHQQAVDLQVDKLILGIPESGQLVEIVKSIKSELAIYLPNKEIILEEETLTTQDAIARIKTLGKRQVKKDKEDAIAAAILLEHYLETNGLW